MDPSSNQRRGYQWLVQMASLIAIAGALFWLFYFFDVVTGSGGPPPEQPPAGSLERYLKFDPDAISDAVSSLGGMNAAVLGIVITVVSIIVQLSADRFTGVARMFLRDRVNLGVMGYYVIATVCGVFVSVSMRHDYVPRVTLLVMMGATAAGLTMMAPYFGYVFWFLEPKNIITRIRRDSVTAATKGAAETEAARSAASQAATLSALEELTDITSNSISGKDKIIASAAVDALKDFTLEYLKVKPAASPAWFTIGAELRSNPDFVAMDPESLGDLEARRTWVEWQVMRQYLGIYNEALQQMRDINYLIAIDTRYLGEAAGLSRDDELVRLCFRFMNSYLRATLNAKDVRTAYNVLNQYRLLVEAMIRQGNAGAAEEGVRHMSYYGHVSFDMKLTFVTETVAYDISALCQYAHETGSVDEERMLQAFLELDRPLRVRSQEAALLGVRKAQVKLAAYYLAQGEEDKARRVAEDMREEPSDRLSQIRLQLERVTTKDFWEIIDRGRNFEYMPEAQRAKMEEFFGWLGVPAG